MTEVEYKDIIKYVHPTEQAITVENLGEHQENRTLLYGYTCDNKSFHVYLKDGEIHTVVYDLEDFPEENICKPKDMREIAVNVDNDYIPDKRLYPEACDYLFCTLLLERGICLPLTSFDKDNDGKFIRQKMCKDKYGKYRGFILEDA